MVDGQPLDFAHGVFLGMVMAHKVLEKVVAEDAVTCEPFSGGNSR
jgi:hypothetical protein